ncbi:unnamed protein product [Pleuronectes platessa]|uniref:Uncharacterized protein n=1 Tax=Pleuronectes platessa TaxID=8262 RepID=A0A9N7V0W2_PLEPL|nr:unnamed protein product [Pleuronectes platessa]
MPKASEVQPISSSPGLKEGPSLAQGAAKAANESPEGSLSGSDGGCQRVANKFCQSPTKASDLRSMGSCKFLCELFKTQIKRLTDSATTPANQRDALRGRCQDERERSVT